MRSLRKRYVNRTLKGVLSALLCCALVLTLLSPEFLTAEASAAEEETAESADYDADGVTYASDELIIVYDETAVSEEDLSDAGVTSEEQIAETAEGAAVLVQLDEDVSVEEAIEALEDDPAIVSVQPNYTYSLLTAEESDADTASVDSDASEDTQYYLYSSSFTDAWEYVTVDGSVTVAVLDTGCNLEHEDLADTVNADLAYDVTTETLLAQSGVSNNGDANGHGTNVCGVISAVANNGIGIAGASYNATILPIKVFDADSSCTTADLVAAYAYLDSLIESGQLTDLKVINMSIGYYADELSDADTALENAIADMLNENGVLTVCAGGNGTGGTANTSYCYPADFEECVSVTAVTKTGANASFSDYNDAKDISAYGVSIYTTSADGGYTTVSGTSVASPQVAAAAALLWAADSSLSASEVVSTLQETADEVTGNLHEETMDIGIVDAQAAVEAVLGVSEDASSDASGDAADDDAGDDAADSGTLDDGTTEDTAGDSASDPDADSAEDTDDIGTADADTQTDTSEDTSDNNAADTDNTADAAEEAADSAEEESDYEIEPEFSSWRYYAGYIADTANTDSTGSVSTLSTYPYSVWKKSYGTSYFGIAKSSSSTTKVSVSGVQRVVIDVSKWQGDIDWEKVAAAGITAAIIRCGYGKDTSSYDDAYFIQNVEGALENGIEIGIYLYSYATTTTYAASEAAHVLRLLEEAGLDPEDLDLPVFLDMEDSTQKSLSASKLGSIAETFCDTIEAEGYPVGIYASKSWWTDYLTDDAFDSETWYKWVARYPTSSSITSCGIDDADLWQFTSHGTVSGIDEDVDVSFDYLGSGSYLPAQVTMKSVSISSTSATSAVIKWNAVSWADGYEIYRATGSGSYSLLKTITSGTTESYTDATLSLGKTYKYKVRPYSIKEVTTTTTETVTDEETGEEITQEVETTTTQYTYGSYSSAKSVTSRPSNATISSAAVVTSSGAIKVTWKKVSNATGYVIYRSTNGGSYSAVKTITSNSTVSWTNTSVKAGRVYRYKIKAYTKSGSTKVYSASYSAVKKVTAKPGKVTISSVTKSSTKRKATVKWKKVTNATGYQVAYRIKGTSKWYYTTVSTNKKIFTSMRNKYYYVKVRAYTKYNGTKYYGAWSSQKLMTVKQ